MTTQQSKNTLNVAKQYLGREISVNVVDEKGNVKKIANCIFLDVSSFSVAALPGEPLISLYAKLKK